MQSQSQIASSSQSFYDPRSGKTSPKQQKKIDLNDAIYQRIVLILPYKSPKLVKHIINSFQQINLKILKLESLAYLATKEFT